MSNAEDGVTPPKDGRSHYSESLLADGRAYRDLTGNLRPSPGNGSNHHDQARNPVAVFASQAMLLVAGLSVFDMSIGAFHVILSGLSRPSRIH